MDLYGHPVLMAADILALDADEVPVGADQAQHLEIALGSAQQFARTYGGRTARAACAHHRHAAQHCDDGASHLLARCSLRLDAIVSSEAYEAPARDENQMSDGARLAFGPLLRSSQSSSR